VVGDFAEKGEAGVAEELAPDAEAIAADVRGVAQLLDVLELGVKGFVFGAVVVDDGDAPAGAGDARHFANRDGVVSEVMGGEADGDDVKGGVGEREFFRGAATGDDVGESTAFGVFGGFSEHGLGEVVGDDLADVRCEGKSGVASAGGDVENGVRWAGRDEGDQRGEGFLIAVASAGGVSGGSGAELRLDRLVDGCAGRFRIHI